MRRQLKDRISSSASSCLVFIRRQIGRPRRMQERTLSDSSEKGMDSRRGIRAEIVRHPNSFIRVIPGIGSDRVVGREKIREKRLSHYHSDHLSPRDCRSCSFHERERELPCEGLPRVSASLRPNKALLIQCLAPLSLVFLLSHGAQRIALDTVVGCARSIVRSRLIMLQDATDERRTEMNYSRIASRRFRFAVRAHCGNQSMCMPLWASHAAIVHLRSVPWLKEGKVVPPSARKFDVNAETSELEGRKSPGAVDIDVATDGNSSCLLIN